MMKALRRGQTMVEYIIITCLIAVSLITVFTFLGRAIAKKAAGAASALSQQEGENAKNAANAISPDSIRTLGECENCGN